MRVTGRTQICGVIGDPIAHTLSPTIHNAAFNHLKLDFIFLAFRVKSDNLEHALEGMRSLGIRGLNVTMPHKIAITRYLDETDSTVKFLSSVNTILNHKGKLSGFNTDGVGALKALRENGLDPYGKKVVLLGAGGAAKAIAYTLSKEVKTLCILNRTPEKAAVLADVLNRMSNNKIVGNILTPSSIQSSLRGADVLINSTSVGMSPAVNESLVPPKCLKPSLIVMDAVYNPVETKLLKDAKAVGAKIISGVEMLLYQGAEAFKIWTGNTAPIEVMRTAALDEIGRGPAK